MSFLDVTSTANNSLPKLDGVPQSESSYLAFGVDACVRLDFMHCPT